MFCAAISKVYKEHCYLREHLQQDEVTKFDHIISKDLTFPALTCALQDLSEYLARYHQQKCVVLIDEYDSLIGTAYHEGYYDKAMKFLRPMFSLLLKVYKRNDNDQKPPFECEPEIQGCRFRSGRPQACQIYTQRQHVLWGPCSP
ncbi:hypothetical protein BC936DRAFT_147143 [Jimgerdemannia flammicorona]|uniref:AAA-ATPase-like domain-containing protein n=1 Tax=Jimgerdemannia flammicorona TaxID=994334 RepID=A0A433DLC3_9FUNG|nr:hypothetical protein BC936DRAFT_147143 [Jimgerdemannia flammicorona]